MPPDPFKIRRRLAIMRAKITGTGGDIAVGDFVRPIYGGPLGFVKHISKNGFATVLRIRSPHGYCDILETIYFAPAAQPGATGLDVRKP